MRLAEDERADLADLLHVLTPGQWEAPSLCAGWRVRDVVAHLLGYDELDAAALLRRFARAGSASTAPTRSDWPTRPTGARAS